MDTSPALTPVEIDRRYWLRGNPAGRLVLRTREGDMCGMGFVCLAAGAAASCLVNQSIPSREAVWRGATHPMWTNSVTVWDAMRANDAHPDYYANDSDREADFANAAAKFGFAVTFIN